MANFITQYRCRGKNSYGQTTKNEQQYMNMNLNINKTHIFVFIFHHACIYVSVTHVHTAE